jgi:hypothetical protein
MKSLRALYLLSFLFAPLSQSQDADASVTYEIEVLIYSTPNFKTKEIFNTKNTFLIDSEKVVELSSPPQSINLTAMSESFKYEYKFSDIFKNILSIETSEEKEKVYSTNSGYWFRELNNGNSLNSLKRRILRRKDYELLDHFTWRQGAVDIEDSPFVYLNEDGKYGLYIKTYKSRYLHLDVKAYLESENDSNLIKLGNKIMAEDNLRKFFIEQTIRVFPNEIYYFDHPRFGVIVSIKDKA